MEIEDQIVFIRQLFNDLEELKVSAEKWNLNFKQLDSGKLEGEMMILDSLQVQLGTVSFNRKFEQKGITPKGYRTFAIPADSSQFFLWREFKITGNHIMLFPATGEIDAINYPGFKVYTFSLSQDLIHKLLAFHAIQFSVFIPEKPIVLELPQHTMTNLRQSVSYLFKMAVKSPDIIEKAAFRQLMMYDVASVLLTSLQSHISIPKISKPRIRDIALNKAITYLNTCSTDFPNVYELCLIAGASQRTLEYAFKEKYGLPPQNYIKKLRLNRVREILKQSDPKNTTINKIASQLGFLHLGQFAADYKKLFGELPSELRSNE